MVWYQENLNCRDRALQLSFDVKKLQLSGREKLVPAERLQQKRRIVELVDDVLRVNRIQNIAELKRQFYTTLTSQERILYERLAKRLEPVYEAVEPTLDVFTIILLFSGSFNKAIDIHEALCTGHTIATMKDYARAFVILFKFGLEAGKTAFASAARSAKLANDIVQDNENITKYASRAAYLLKQIVKRSFDPDPSISNLSGLTNQDEQKQNIRIAIHELYSRRLVSLFFERLCDAMMLQDGLLLSYVTHLAEGHQLHADETANLLLKAMTNAWQNIDTATSVNMMVGNDSRRNAWVEGDPHPSEAVRLTDEMKAQIGISGSIQGTTMAGYDLRAIANLYSTMGYGESDPFHPNADYDAGAELQDIDRIFVQFLPYPS